MELIDWLVFAALAVSLLNVVMIIGLNEKINKADMMIQLLLTQAIITSELLQLMDQENNADE